MQNDMEHGLIGHIMGISPAPAAVKRRIGIRLRTKLGGGPQT